MRHPIPSNLVRFNLHMRRDHVQRLSQLAQLLAKKKGRDVRLAEAIELALVAGLHWKDSDLLDLSLPDRTAPYWLQVGPIDRTKWKALTPSALGAQQ
ncbi:hypothetical protein [Pseudomonas sp. EA_35y_Pfl2_R5]|uniref:hypothetical protein n=1 Tax=Pseudomonas sp. EA_35y_Pfl2_R5 TaxID=3088690 RepID=UPI0030D75C03